MSGHVTRITCRIRLFIGANIHRIQRRLLRIEEKGYIDLTLACVQFIVSTTRTWWKRRYFLGTKPKKSWGVRRIKLKAFAVGYWIYVYLILRKNWIYYTSLHFFVVLLSRWNFVVFLYSCRYLQFFCLFWDRSYASLKIPKIIKNKLRIAKIWNYLFFFKNVLRIFKNVISHEEQVFGYELIYLNDSIGWQSN